MCASKGLMLKCDPYIAILETFNCVQKRAQAHLKMLSIKTIH